MSEESARHNITVARYLTVWQHDTGPADPTMPLGQPGYCRTVLPATRCTCGMFHIVIEEEAHEDA